MSIVKTYKGLTWYSAYLDGGPFSGQTERRYAAQTFKRRKHHYPFESANPIKAGYPHLRIIVGETREGTIDHWYEYELAEKIGPKTWRYTYAGERSRDYTDGPG